MTVHPVPRRYVVRVRGLREGEARDTEQLHFLSAYDAKDAAEQALIAERVLGTQYLKVLEVRPE